ncbi:MAG: hypothetical protein WDO12_04970 [Pseudomonadota bacterium]
MSLDRSSVMRLIWTAIGCAALLIALVLLARQQLVVGFLFAFAALSVIGVGQSGLDYSTRYRAKTFIGEITRTRTPISALGKFCVMASYLCLAAAGISWLALR